MNHPWSLIQPEVGKMYHEDESHYKLINEPIDLTTLNHGMMQTCFFINPTLPATFRGGKLP